MDQGVFDGVVRSLGITQLRILRRLILTLFLTIAELLEVRLLTTTCDGF